MLSDKDSSYALALTKLHEQRFSDNPDKIANWISALSRVAPASRRSYKKWQLLNDQLVQKYSRFRPRSYEEWTEWERYQPINRYDKDRTRSKKHEYERMGDIVNWVTSKIPRPDLFLSFLGRDTRYSFVDFLHDALERERFKIHMHHEESEDVDQISQSLVETIDKSWLSIVVLSENYASSSLCLDELVKILECMDKKTQLVLPIFYKVEASDVRHQRNSFGAAMAKHENRFGENAPRVQKWRSALAEVANLKGSHLKTEYEYEIVDKIVEVAINAIYVPSPSSSVS